MSSLRGDQIMVHQPTLLVTGASGHLGRRVVELLLEAQAETVIATTRTPTANASDADAAAGVASFTM